MIAGKLNRKEDKAQKGINQMYTKNEFATFSTTFWLN